MKLKIGLLIPNSNFISEFGNGFQKALHLGLSLENTDDIEFIIESGGYNADRKMIAEKISKLTSIENVDLLIAPLNPGVFGVVKEILESNQTPAIIATLGEDIWFHENDSEFLFVNTFDQWKSNWLLGKWAAENMGKNCGMFSCYHEAGYRLSYPYALGLESEKGQIVSTKVTHKNTRTEDSAEDINDLENVSHDFCIGFYSSKEAVSFIECFVKEQADKKRTPLVGSTFMLEPFVLEKTGSELVGTKTTTSWDFNSQDDENQVFREEYKKLTDKDPDAYSLLAYEIGMIVRKGLDSLGDEKKDKATIKQLLASDISIQGPRGKTKLNFKGSEDCDFKVYLTEVQNGQEGVYLNKVVEELVAPKLYYEQLTLAKQRLSKEGWFNPYLIA